MVVHNNSLFSEKNGFAESIKAFSHLQGLANKLSFSSLPSPKRKREAFNKPPYNSSEGGAPLRGGNVPQRGGESVATICVQSTQNNTILTLTDLSGNTKGWTSSGCLGFRNTRKSTTYAAQAAAEKIAGKALALGFVAVKIRVKGLGYGKQSSVRALHKSGLRIVSIEETTPVPHNGCRLPKKRRT